MEIHSSTDISVDAQKSWRDSDVWKTLEAVRPWLQWLLVGIFAVGSLYLYTRDTNAEQGVSLRELEKRQTQVESKIDAKTAAIDKRFEMFEANQVTMQLFNERTNRMDKQLDNIDKRTMEILDRLPVRNP